MPEMAKQPLPSGPSTLCFNKEDFMKDDFNVEYFVVECRRKVPLEMLRNDLHVYLKILQSAMIELINKDYADFVNLSTNLIGMDKAINNLLNPLNHLKNEIMNVRNAMVEAGIAVDEKMKQHTKIKERKECLRTMMGIIQSLEKMEKLLGILPSDHTGHHLRELNGQLIERVATEFNKLQFYVSKCHGWPLVEEIKPRIAQITLMLQYSLEGSFKEGLTNGNSEILRDCLRTYATIDKMRDAENLFRTFIVKGYMEEIINEQYLRSHPQGLEGLYNAVLDFFPKHCSKLCELTTTFVKGSKEAINGYDFVVNSVWPEVVGNLEARMPSIFAPGNPNIFHEKYMVSIRFLERFERQCGSQMSVKRLRAHSSYNTFLSKWSLPVYFQIRFQEIAGSLESSLMTSFTPSTDKHKFNLQCSSCLWDCLHRCWSKNIYLVPLCHRFWKLSLQLFSRYAVWITEVYEEMANRQLPQRDLSTNLQQIAKAANGDSNSIISPATTLSTGTASTVSSFITISNIVMLVSDAQKITTEVPEFFDSTVAPLLKEIGIENLCILKGGLKDGETAILTRMPNFEAYITTEITALCVTHLKSVNDIPRLYRRTNREVPSKPSSYATSLVSPLVDFLKQHADAISETNRKQWCILVLQSVGEQFLSITTDVLTAVKKMEESLKRLKAGRGASVTGGSQGMSDDDKIRQQLYLDVKEFGQQITSLQVLISDVEVYGRLYNVAKSAIIPSGVGASI